MENDTVSWTLAGVSALVAGLLGRALFGVLSSLLTETVLKRLILWGLKKASKSTKNSVDDELLKIVEDAFTGTSEATHPCDLHTPEMQVPASSPPPKDSN